MSPTGFDCRAIASAPGTRAGGQCAAAVLAMVCATTIAPSRVAGEGLSRESRIETLLAAQRAFDRGAEVRRSDSNAAARHFRESAELFQRLIDDGVRNGRLFYNLANAQLQLGRIGPAILNYRRAERLIPGDGRLEANLRFARELRHDQLPETGERALLRTLFFWHYSTPLRLRYVLALAAYVAIWLFLTVREFMPRVRWMYAVAPVAVIWLALSASALIELTAPPHREGVLTANEVTVRKGNGAGFEPQFNEPLHEGVEFRLLERRGDWLHIRLPTGKDGWIRADQAGLI